MYFLDAYLTLKINAKFSCVKVRNMKRKRLVLIMVIVSEINDKFHEWLSKGPFNFPSPLDKENLAW